MTHTVSRMLAVSSAACLFAVGLVRGGAVDVDAQHPELREGTCELAGELFPDTNP